MLIEKLHSLFVAHPVISIDTRSLQKDSIFFCLRGNNYDGNSFVRQALEKGAAYVVTDNCHTLTSERIIVVNDSLKTLQYLASYHRNKFDIPVFGITGTNGKTTTKELLHAVLSEKFKTLATKGNLNNHIGVPLTLLNINDKTQFAIIEMGASHPGEIEHLCHIANPGFGLITNIGRAHLDGFGTTETIFTTKRALHDYVINKGGTFFLNSDDSLLKTLPENPEFISYGCNPDAIYQGTVIESKSGCSVKCIKPDDYIINTQLAGSYNFQNIMASIAVGSKFGIDKVQIIKSLERYKPANNRSQIIQTSNNLLIMDAYNANPSSLEAAIIDFAKNDAENKMCVLGDMLELGDFANDEHRKIIELIQKHGLTNSILVGPLFCKAAFGRGYVTFKTATEAHEYLVSAKLSGITVLIKGSRGIALEVLQSAF